jgi:hypothetical protein
MPAHHNRGIVTIRDVTRTAVAMEQLSKHARNSRSAVFCIWSAPRPLLCNGEVNTLPQLHRGCFLCGPCRGVIKGERRSFKTVEFWDTSLSGYELGSRGIEVEDWEGLWRWQSNDWEEMARKELGCAKKTSCVPHWQTVINPLPGYD